MNILHAFFVVVLAVIVTADGSASSWNASDAFPEDVTAFASSAAAIRDDERIVDLCLRDGTPLLEHLFAKNAERYRSLDSVLVFDWGGQLQNGLGNTLMKYAKILSEGPLVGRAVFIKRNTDNCGTEGAGPCRMDPGAFLGVRERRTTGPTAFGTIDWRWTALAAEATARRMAELGATEHVFRFSQTAPGLVDTATNITVLADSGIEFLLKVQHIPWIRVAAPIAGGAEDGALNQFLKPLGRPGWWPTWIDGLDKGGNAWADSLFPYIERALYAAAPGTTTTGAAPPPPPPLPGPFKSKFSGVNKSTIVSCLYANYLRPLPPLQSAVAPLLKPFDDVFLAGGAVGGLHLRSGFADYAMSADDAKDVHAALQAQRAAAAGGAGDEGAQGLGPGQGQGAGRKRSRRRREARMLLAPAPELDGGGVGGVGAARSSSQRGLQSAERGSVLDAEVRRGWEALSSLMLPPCSLSAPPPPPAQPPLPAGAAVAAAAAAAGGGDDPSSPGGVSAHAARAVSDTHRIIGGHPNFTWCYEQVDMGPSGRVCAVWDRCNDNGNGRWQSCPPEDKDVADSKPHFDWLPDEVASPNTGFAAFIGCAVHGALALQHASDPLPGNHALSAEQQRQRAQQHPPAGSAGGGGGGGANASAASDSGERPWLLFVAGDYPVVPTLAAYSRSLAGHVVTADAVGEVGHVSNSFFCKHEEEKAVCTQTTDPGGSWTRTVADLYLMSLCDFMVTTMGTSFPQAALLRVGPAGFKGANLYAPMQTMGSQMWVVGDWEAGNSNSAAAAQKRRLTRPEEDKLKRYMFHVSRVVRSRLVAAAGLSTTMDGRRGGSISSNSTS